MFGRGSSTNIAVQRELEEIVADLPLPTATINNGPASTSQHSPSLKIHCSNPNDISRVTSFKHFQDCVIGVTKDGLYFMADKLERMFPENATRTKVLLGTFNAVQLLRDHGATMSKASDHSLRGTLLHFPAEAMMGGFQDPFFTCEPLISLPPPPPFASLHPTGSSTSGLLLGVNLKGGLMSLLSSKLNVWQVLATAGVHSFFQGLVVGFVDEILGTLVPLRYRNRLSYIKNLLKGASALIGTSVLVYMIVNKKTTLTAAVIAVLISYVCNLVGGAVGTGLGNLLKWVKRNYFDNDNENNNNNIINNNNINNNYNNDANVCLPTHVNLQGDSNRSSSSIILPSSDGVHCCNQEDNGYMHIGLCINCNIQPAVFGFVHKNDNTAHSAFCLGCSSLYRGSTCVCCAEVSSTYYFSPASMTCSARTCIAAATCVTCDEDDAEVPKTASVWRLKKSEETQVTHRTVALDVRYCLDHMPLATHHDVFRYGRLYSTGYI